MALTGSENTPRASFSGARAVLRAPLERLWTRVSSRLGDADQMMVHRLAGTVFMIRVVAAALAFVSNVLLARWMGTFEFGVFVYVWTWVLLIGQALDLGLSTAAQRFIPEYRERGLIDLLRGYIAHSRWLAVGFAIAVAILCAGFVWLLTPLLDSYFVIPLYIACIALPAYALANVQDGIARSYDWVGLGIVPTYVVRQLLLTALMAAAYFGGPAGGRHDCDGAVGRCDLAPGAVANDRARPPPGDAHRAGTEGAQHQALGRHCAADPDGRKFLSAADVCRLLMLQQFRSPEDVAVYYAAVKTLALVAFIYFAIAATTAHRVRRLSCCRRPRRSRGVHAQGDPLTFWPSLFAAVLLLAFGKPILALFGPQFADGYHLMFILAIGLVARAAIGPMERFLNVIGEQRACAAVYAGAFAINIVLCIALIPPLGAAGAAIAITAALVVETIALVVLLKQRMGLDIFVWGRRN